MIELCEDNTITMTQGDTLDLDVDIYIKNCCSEVKERYVPSSKDKIRFALKGSYDDPEPIIVKEIPPQTLRLRLESAETKLLECRKKPYVYDIELTTPNGTVDTFIDRAQLFITEEVY